jgi:hypothetical protein
MYQVHTGRILMGYPGMGSWVTYGLGSESENLPAYVVMPQPDDLRDHQLSGGPSWLDSDRYDIVAKAEGGIPSEVELKQMVQAMLADRFQLTIHREPQSRWQRTADEHAAGTVH